MQGTGTSEQAVQLTKALLQKVGKTPLVCKENPGFIHNYIQTAMTRAAISLVDIGIRTGEDRIPWSRTSSSCGLARLGPIGTCHYAGLETLLGVMEYLHEKTRDSTFQAAGQS